MNLYAGAGADVILKLVHSFPYASEFEFSSVHSIRVPRVIGLSELSRESSSSPRKFIPLKKDRTESKVGQKE